MKATLLWFGGMAVLTYILMIAAVGAVAQ